MRRERAEPALAGTARIAIILGKLVEGSLVRWYVCGLRIYVLLRVLRWLAADAACLWPHFSPQTHSSLLFSPPQFFRYFISSRCCRCDVYAASSSHEHHTMISHDDDEERSWNGLTTRHKKNSALTHLRRALHIKLTRGDAGWNGICDSIDNGKISAMERKLESFNSPRTENSTIATTTHRVCVSAEKILIFCVF